MFNTDVLVRTISEDARKNTTHDFGKNIIPTLVEQGNVFAFNFKHGNCNPSVYWRDIGLLEAYWEANMDLVSDNPEFDLYDANWPIRTYHSPFPPSRVFLKNIASTRMVISGGCLVHDTVLVRCILSNNVRVERGAELSESILMEDVTVGENARLRKTIVDKHVSIPPGIQIGYDLDRDKQRFTVTPNGVVVIPQGLPVEA